MARSRVFKLPLQDRFIHCFLPFMDMLNHREPRQTSWNYDDQREGAYLIIEEDTASGSPVYSSYGSN